MIQSIIFNKLAGWTKKSATRWLKLHKYRKILDEKTNTYRARQINPILHGKYYTKKLPNGISLVIASST